MEALYPTGYMAPLITPVILGGQNVEGQLGDGKDQLRGGAGTDFLFGGDEADQLRGDDGELRALSNICRLACAKRASSRSTAGMRNVPGR